MEQDHTPLWPHEAAHEPTTPSLPDHVPMQRGRVAVVEDGESTRYFLVQHLRTAGYQVKGIEDGASALPLLRLHQPDLVLLDVSLPGLTGFEVCRQLRADPLLRSAVVIMLTGQATSADRQTAQAAGADDYLVKPCDLAELLARVAAHLRHRETPAHQWRNPITGLPAVAALAEVLEERVQAHQPFAVGYVDIAHFRSYNQRYGYVAGDALLEVLADLLREVASDLDANRSPDAAIFVGHLGSDDFMLIGPPDAVSAVCSQVAVRFQAVAPLLYQSMDRARGWVPGTDQRGATRQFPFVAATTTSLIYQPKDAMSRALEPPALGLLADLWQRLHAATALRPTG